MRIHVTPFALTSPPAFAFPCKEKGKQFMPPKCCQLIQLLRALTALVVLFTNPFHSFTRPTEFTVEVEMTQYITATLNNFA